MTDTPKKSHGEGGVNRTRRGRVDLTGTTATLSLLGEGRVYCAECGMPIDGLAAYLTKPRYEKHEWYKIVAVLHPDCYEGEAS
jgi:hypothetical protein